MVSSASQGTNAPAVQLAQNRAATGNCLGVRGQRIIAPRFRAEELITRLGTPVVSRLHAAEPSSRRKRSRWGRGTWADEYDLVTCSGDPDAEKAASRSEGRSFPLLIEERPGVLALNDDDAIELLALGLVQGHQHNATRLGLGRQQLFPD